jgi:hypothetical protein
MLGTWFVKRLEGDMPHTRRDPGRQGRGRAASSTLAGLLAASIAVVALVGITGTAGAAPAPRKMAPLAARIGDMPLIPRGAKLVGALAKTTVIHIDVVLEPRDPAALAAYAADVSNPKSSLYKHFLAKGQFASRFGPTAAAISAVEASLRSEGLDPGALPSDHLSIPIEATAGALAKAFSTSFERVETGGRVSYANTSAPLIAGSARPYVEGVIGLDDLYKPTPLAVAPKHESHAAAAKAPASVHPHTGNGPQPCTAAVTAADDSAVNEDDYGGYTSDELASVYGLNGLYLAGDEGAGTTIGIFELEPFTSGNISTFQTCYGTSATVNVIDNPTDGGPGTGAGSGEAALDIEDAISFAPKATIDVYESVNNSWTDAYDNYQEIATADPQVVSTSWGECEYELGSTDADAEDDVFAQMATQGQSVFAAAGDNGSEDCDSSPEDDDSDPMVDDPSGQPDVTGVGGTYLPTTGNDNTPELADQDVWNDQYGAGGGGISQFWPMPGYQSDSASSLGVVAYYDDWQGAVSYVCTEWQTTGCRQTPDVSADASPDTGIVFYYTGTGTGSKDWQVIGGTSLGAPLWASIGDLIDDSSGCGDTRLGQLDTALYDAAGANYSGTFTDVTQGYNDFTGDAPDGVFPAATGYDDASGLGTPNALAIADAVCTRAPNAPSSVTPTMGSEATAGDGQVKVTWTAPNDNGSPISSYKVTPSPSCSGCGGTTTSGTSTTVTGLTPGTSYTFSVTATNGIGTSSAGTSIAITPVTIPGATTGVSASAGSETTAGNGEVVLSWTAPSANGSAISAYSVSSSPTCSGCSGLTPTTNSTTVTGLTPGTTYTFSVAAQNSAGPGASGSSGSIEPITVPGGPTSVLASGASSPQAGDAEMTVSWTAPSAYGSTITSYTIVPTPSCSGCANLSVTTSPSTVTGLTPGTPYTFAVTAHNGAGAGAAGTSNSQTAPATVPDAPTSVTASQGPHTTPGDGEIDLSWGAAQANGDTVTSYTVTVSPTCSGCSGLSTTGATSTLIGGLTPGGSYTFTVYGTNAIGNSATGGSNSESAPATAPSTPSDVVASGASSPSAGDSEMSLSWTAPAANGESITSYTVTPTPACPACSGLTPSAAGTTVAGLTPGTSYTFSVVANNLVGPSAAGTSNSETAPATVPNAPSGVTVTQASTAVAGDGQVTLSWAAPAGNGDPITSYTVTPSPTCSCGGLTLSGTSTTVTGLSPGTGYTFSVYATNIVGKSASGTSASITPVTIPGTPSNVVASGASSPTAGDAVIDVSWSAPSANGGTISTYTIAASPACSLCDGLSVSGGSTSSDVSGLTPGTSYSFSVTATNTAGNSGAGTSNVESAPPTVPDAPGTVTASAGPGTVAGDGEIDLSWAAPSANGAAITGYTVTPSPACSTGCSGLTPTGVSTTITGLTPGTAYSFDVTAANSQGPSAAGASGSIVPKTIPGTPASVLATQQSSLTAGDAEIALTWNAPSGYGSNVTVYTVSPSPACATCAGLSPTTASTTVSGLSPGTTYSFTVTATNGVGTGTGGISNSEQAPATPPNAPTAVSASAGSESTAGDGQLVVSWTAPAANDSAISGYRLTPSPACSSCAGLTASGTSTTVTGLSPGTAYTFGVQAINGIGTGPTGTSGSATPITVPEAPPIGTATTVTGQGIDVTWIPLETAPANGGSTITGYVVTPLPACTGCGGLDLSGPSADATTVTGLTEGQTYSFTVEATNAAGTGAPSASSNSTSAPTSVPGLPGAIAVSAGSVATPGDGQLHLSWSAPTADGGLTVSGYKVAVVSPACTTCVVGAITGTTTTITGLTPGTAYIFSVAAENSLGFGDAAESAKSIAYTIPAAPAAAPTVKLSGSSVVVTYKAPADIGGEALTGYVITPSPACPTCKNLTTTKLTTTVTGLKAGEVYKFTVRAENKAGAGPVSPASAAVTIPLLDGYWLVTREGSVYALGAAVYEGGLRTTSTDPVVGIANSPDGKGYFLATSNGTVDAFGDVKSYGDLPAKGITRTNIVTIVATEDGNGYWLVGADGEVYSFGDAPFYGSLLTLPKPVYVSNIVGMVACAGDAGYLLIGSDGGVFAFGRTHFYGSLPGIGVKVDDIRGILPSTTNTGYVLVGADGGAFVFGSGTRFYGSLPGRGIVVSDIVGLAITPDGGGYYMAGSNGAVYGFGDAIVDASPPGLSASLPVAAIAGV